MSLSSTKSIPGQPEQHREILFRAGGNKEKKEKKKKVRFVFLVLLEVLGVQGEEKETQCLALGWRSLSRHGF